jgi:hypothetical protein
MRCGSAGVRGTDAVVKWRSKINSDITSKTNEMSYECDVNDSLAQILVRGTDGFRYIEVKRSQQTTQLSSPTIDNLKMKKI